jgi:hypothetical protein
MKKITVLLLLLAMSTVCVFADNNAVVIRQLIRQCEQNLGVRITINQTSDRRTERRQAELMADMSPAQRRSLYNNAYYVTEMNGYDNLPRSQKIDKFEQIIKTAQRNRSKVSSHLTADAVDIAPSTSQVRQWLEGNGIKI